ncbi:hypothetical protein ambt_07395 [Alteromonas naphthalenivorans]|uniref:Uncharacterized protein n=1 Tax=Alteromonas naphthalenivorans TaxID=715451 RepID=F5Z7G9_ALTNA|nr:hypothetical protein ambt_07395 [Alteromonas naphthalenivorans]
MNARFSVFIGKATALVVRKGNLLFRYIIRQYHEVLFEDAITGSL